MATAEAANLLARSQMRDLDNQVCPWPFADTQRHRWTLFPLLLI
jgi:hypothetical protein